MKNVFLISAILIALGLSNRVIAGNLYISPALFAQEVTAAGSRYRDIYMRLPLGYEELVNQMYLAGEIFYIPTTLNSSDNHPNGATSARVLQSMGASFFPGMVLNDQLIGFARLGVIDTKFTGVGITKMGAQIGLGFKYMLSPEWDVRGEYIHSVYQSMPQLGTAKSNEIGIGVSYKIDL